MRRLVSAVVVAVAATLVAPAAPAAARPAAPHPDNRPTPLAGHENGRVPDSELVTVAPGCKVARAAGPSLRLLFERARAAGVSLGTRSCYRPIDGQVAARRRWAGAGNAACAAPVQRTPDGRPKGTSMHGWGKAVDFSNAGGPMTFSSAGYRWLDAEAARYGWNHPGWARPGGGPCPEPWHWEWVGDGGTLGLDPVRADAVAFLPSGGAAGYSVVTGLGAVAHRGGAAAHGDAEDVPLSWVVVGAARVPGGYWLVAADGGVFSFGDARFFGSTGGMRLREPIVGMAATPSGRGYWLVAADGGVFSFGDARFFGSTGGMRLREPIVGVAATPSGRGYWLVAADGGVFSFGDARFFGSTGAMRLQQPIVAMAPAGRGDGYWLAAADGGVFTFGAARFHGSLGGRPPRAPVVAMAATPSGGGYWMLAADGGVFAFGAAAFHGAG